MRICKRRENAICKGMWWLGFISTKAFPQKQRFLPMEPEFLFPPLHNIIRSPLLHPGAGQHQTSRNKTVYWRGGTGCYRKKKATTLLRWKPLNSGKNVILAPGLGGHGIMHSPVMIYHYISPINAWWSQASCIMLREAGENQCKSSCSLPLKHTPIHPQLGFKNFKYGTFTHAN